MAGCSGSGGCGSEVLPCGCPGPVGAQAQHEPPGGGHDPGWDGDQLGAQGCPADLRVPGALAVVASVQGTVRPTARIRRIRGAGASVKVKVNVLVPTRKYGGPEATAVTVTGRYLQARGMCRDGHAVDLVHDSGLGWNGDGVVSGAAWRHQG
jgi:hypothetical protein